MAPDRVARVRWATDHKCILDHHRVDLGRIGMDLPCMVDRISLPVHQGLVRVHRICKDPVVDLQ